MAHRVHLRTFRCSLFFQDHLPKGVLRIILTSIMVHKTLVPSAFDLYTFQTVNYIINITHYCLHL